MTRKIVMHLPYYFVAEGTKVKKIPTPIEFLLEEPLYKPVAFSEVERGEVVNILAYSGTYDSYCKECGRPSTFQVFAPNSDHGGVPQTSKWSAAGQPYVPDGIHPLYAKCTRGNLHRQHFIFFVKAAKISEVDDEPQYIQTLEKIGQQPSYGDHHETSIDKYKRVLTRDQRSELVRAIRLASHDVGVGSYVYLRRIFEALVEDARKIASSQSDWDEASYQTLRVSEKIRRLSSHLPDFLVQNPKMYGLLSKGIHELSDDECLRHFDTLRNAIELILDERLQKLQHAEKIASATDALQKATASQ
jgi:hypothetical protein